jgi:PST family polysaccharide transporter
MNAPQTSSRDVLRSTTIVGSVTLITLIVGLARAKTVAVVLGTQGVGLIGIYTSILAMAFSIAGFGIHSSGVRQIAASAEDPVAAELSLRALWTLSIVLAMIGGGLFWLVRHPVTVLVTGTDRYVAEVGWLSLGIVFSMLSGAMMASIQGFRRMGDFARMQLFGTVAAAIVGVGAVVMFGEAGVVVVVLAPSAAACVFGYAYARKLPVKPRFGERTSVLPIWKALIRVGIAITVTALMGSATQIAARTIVVRETGLDGAGLFQAAWAISAINIGLLLAAMGADYYPRLSGVAHDPKLMSEEVNRQVHVALVLAGPLLVGVTAMAPVVLWLLYSRDFGRATELLQWLTAADALRLTGWALGFVMLARQASFSYVAIEASFGLVFVPALLVLAPLIGLPAAGVAYFAGYLICLIVSMTLARYLHGVAVSRTNMVWTGALTALLVGLTMLYTAAPLLAAIIGVLAALGLTVHSLGEIARMGVSIPVIGPVLDGVTARGRAWLRRD